MTRASSSVTGRRARWAAAGIVALVAIGSLAPVGLASSARPAAGFSVLSVYQTPARITEHSAFSVFIQVSDPAMVAQAYFTFCQLTSSVCYKPVAMTEQAGGWFTGTTDPMNTYLGMSIGVHAGYNITLVLTDNSTLFEPVLPNPFTNLTVAQTVIAENMFEIVVSDEVFGLSGNVVDAATGAAVSGANVTLTPGTALSTTTDGAGHYAFANLTNGSYSLAVSRAGYDTTNQSVAVSGSDVVQDVSLATPGSGTHPSAGGGPSANFVETPLGWASIGAAVLVLVAIAVVVMRSRGRGGRSAPPST